MAGISVTAMFAATAHTADEFEGDQKSDIVVIAAKLKQTGLNESATATGGWTRRFGKHRSR